MTIFSTTMELHTQLDVPRMSVDNIVIVADDLTGACDGGVAFLAAARRVRVMLCEPGLVPELSNSTRTSDQSEVWAFTTETRDLSRDEAADRVAKHVKDLTSLLESALLFKKIDSAGRGHFGVEIDEALRSSRAALALVAPAFPATGRTVDAGVLSVRDWSGQNNATPLRDQFQHESSSSIEILPAGSAYQLEQGIARALANDTRILLCDATTQADLEHLAAAGLRAQSPLLWAGSAGLAYALAGKLPVSALGSGAPIACRLGHTLLFVGTPHPVTSLQVAHLERQPHGAGRTIHRIPSAAAVEQDVVAAFTAKPVGALILTGGDTASFVLRALGACSIRLAGEIASGIPWGIVKGGLADGCTVVTKSGGFGDRDALVHAFEFCERRSCDPA